MSETNTAAIPAPKKGKKTLLIVGVAVAVLAAAGGGAFWWTSRAEAATEEEEPAPKRKAARERGIVAFEPFVVNLADPGISRFLRVKVQLVVDSPEEAEELTKSLVKTSQTRSIILELLTTQTSEVLVTPDGKAALKKALIERIADGPDHLEVIDVLFSDFVVQF